MKLAEIFHFLAEIKVQTYESMGNRLVVTNIVIKTFGGQSFRHKSQKTVPLRGWIHAQSADTPLHRDWFSHVVADDVPKSIFKSIDHGLKTVV